MQEAFWLLTKYMLGGDRAGGKYYFNDERRMFGTIEQEVRLGRIPYGEEGPKLGCSFAYQLIFPDDERKKPDYMHHMTWQKQNKFKPRPYKPSSSLGQNVLHRAKDLTSNPAHLILQADEAIKAFQGKEGWLVASSVAVSSLEETEELIFTLYDKSGHHIKAEGSLLLKAPIQNIQPYQPCLFEVNLQATHEQYIHNYIKQLEEQNLQYFEEEMEKLHFWAADKKDGLEIKLNKLNREIGEIDRISKKISMLKSKLEYQKRKAKLEQQRSNDRSNLYGNKASIDSERDRLIKEMRQHANTSRTITPVFTLSWKVE